MTPKAYIYDRTFFNTSSKQQHECKKSARYSKISG
jgi:hypothetical protein